ncbi:VOC family protein [Lolliginicoccus suaedae]|uniref:VOC family protein n=1 Tax=Lolliginicoccus suaedae TaxID=2605429 RepID=UPI0011F025F2|nr:VOC family protein [Lolliginicoccus suaedae]
MAASITPRIVPNLWFNSEAAEAAEFYTSVFPNSRIVRTSYYPANAPMPEGTVLTVDFELDGQRFTALNGGADIPFTDALSLLVNCADQQEVDYYWEALSAGGKEVQCGWLADKYGLSWQIVPEGLDDVLAGDDADAVGRAFTAMLGMTKLDIAALRAAREGS